MNMPWEEIEWSEAPKEAEYHTTDWYGAAFWTKEPVLESDGMWKVSDEDVNDESNWSVMVGWPMEYARFGFWPNKPNKSVPITIAKRGESQKVIEHVSL